MNNAEPKITILTTVYNGIHYLPLTVESVLTQTLTDFEYIIVDDGSNDGTEKYLKSLTDPRVQVITLPRSGRGWALNQGVHRARGKYLAILDADDLAFPNRLELQYEVMEKIPSGQRCAVLGTPFSLSPHDQCWKNVSNLQVQNLDIKNFIRKNALCHSSTMIKLSALKEVSAYDSSRTVLFDYDLWVRLALKGFQFKKLNIPLVFKRIHEQQNFEQKRRLLYLTEATKCKLSLIHHGPKKQYALDYALVIMTFFYGLLPNSFRKILMERWS